MLSKYGRKGDENLEWDILELSLDNEGATIIKGDY